MAYKPQKFILTHMEAGNIKALADSMSGKRPLPGSQASVLL